MKLIKHFDFCGIPSLTVEQENSSFGKYILVELCLDVHWFDCLPSNKSVMKLDLPESRNLYAGLPKKIKLIDHCTVTKSCGPPF